MKKIALAAVMALASGFVGAQTVEVYGKMKVYQDFDKVGTAESVTRLTNDTSRIGFKGTESIGNGLTARFVIETGIGADAATATSLGDREALVGIAGKNVSVDLGRAKHAVARLNDKYDAMGGNIYGSSTSVIHSLHGSRVSNTAFVGLTPMKNLSVTYNHVFSEAAGVKDTQVVGADYTIGAGSVGVAHLDNGAAGAKSTIVGARYQVIPGTTLFGMYSDDNASGVTTKGKSLGLRQQLPANLIGLVSYAEKDGAQAVKAYNLGLTYQMSKRTFINARYRLDDSVVAANDRKQFGLGIEHNF